MPKRRNYDVAPGCSMEAVLNIINGRWKGVILYHLLEGTLRFNALRRHLPGCTPALLVKQLRELEEDGFVHREVFAEAPARVEYRLTDEGRTIEPLLIGLSEWGEGWLERRGLRTSKVPVARRPSAPILADPGPQVS